MAAKVTVSGVMRWWIHQVSYHQKKQACNKCWLLASTWYDAWIFLQFFFWFFGSHQSIRKNTTFPSWWNRLGVLKQLGIYGIGYVFVSCFCSGRNPEKVNLPKWTSISRMKGGLQESGWWLFNIVYILPLLFFVFLLSNAPSWKDDPTVICKKSVWKIVMISSFIVKWLAIPNPPTQIPPLRRV